MIKGVKSKNNDLDTFMKNQKNKETVMKQFENRSVSPVKEHMRMTAYPQEEEALLTWFKAACAENIPDSGLICKQRPDPLLHSWALPTSPAVMDGSLGSRHNTTSSFAYLQEKELLSLLI